MKFLFVVVLLIFTGSCSVSPQQYYVSDNCSSVTYTPCVSELPYYVQETIFYINGSYSSFYYFNGSNDSIYYFIGTSYITFIHYFYRVRNVTLLGLSHSPTINCRGGTFAIVESSHFNIGNISFYDCDIGNYNSNHVMITNSTHHYGHERKSMVIFRTSNIAITKSIFQNFEIRVTNASDMKFAKSSCHHCIADISNSIRVTIIDSNFSLISKAYYRFTNLFDMAVMSTVFIGGVVRLHYLMYESCNYSTQLQNSVILNNVSILDTELVILITQGTAYNVSIQFNYVSANGIVIMNAFGFHSIHINNTKSSNGDIGLYYEFNPTPFATCL